MEIKRKGEKKKDAPDLNELAKLLQKALDKTAKPGARGEKGERGLRGERGAQGFKGERGDEGEKGERGEKGIQGVKGEKGDRGDRGEQGIAGKDGAPGKKGEKGDRGPHGIRGKAGADGRGIVSVTQPKPGIAHVNFTDGTHDVIMLPAGKDGRDVELRATTDWIQWRLEGERSWKNLLQISVLKAAAQGGFAGGGQLIIKVKNLSDVKLTNLQDGETLVWNAAQQKWINAANSPIINWGDIQGTLSDQTDLQTALDAKYDASNPDGFISGVAWGEITGNLLDQSDLVLTFAAFLDLRVARDGSTPLTANWDAGAFTITADKLIADGSSPQLQLGSGTGAANLQSGSSSSAKTHTLPNITGTLATLANLQQKFLGSMSFSQGIVIDATTKQIQLASAGGGAGSIITASFAGSLNWTMPSRSATISTLEANTYSGNQTLQDTFNLIFGTTTGSKIGTATTQKIGFWNATPVVQPAQTGTTTAGFTQNASANDVYAESTFTGNSGSTAYTVSDIVRNLKAAGLLAA